MAKIAMLALRAVQLLFLAVVVGLSATLVKGQLSGSAPAVTVFAVVCGIWGALVALVGIAACFIESISGLVMLVLDGLATLFFFAGSIAMAVQLGIGSCTGNYGSWVPSGPNPYCGLHPIIAGGGITWNGNSYVYGPSGNWFVTRCRMAQANTAFLFFALVTFLVSLTLSFMGWRRKDGKTLTVL